MKTSNHNSLRFIGLICLALTAFSAKAQPDDDVDFFTDSDVKQSILGIDIYATPNITSSNLLEENRAFLFGDYTYQSSENTGGFGLNYGLGLVIAPNRTLDFRLGIQYGVYRFGYDLVEVFDSNDELLTTGTSSIEVTFIDVPVKMAFHQPLGDNWEVEYGIGLEFNFLRDYTNTIQLEENSFFNELDQTQDYTDSANANNLTISLQLGINYQITSNVHLIFTPNFRYVFRSLVPNGSQNQEAFYTLGAISGLRFRF